MPMRKPLIVAGLLLLAAFFRGCGSHETSMDGVWSVDFGESDEGVLRLESGNVHALCYGDTKIGTYSMKQDAVTMKVRFNPGAAEVVFQGTIEKQTDAGLILRLEFPQGASLPFTPYAGDCSEIVLDP